MRLLFILSRQKLAFALKQKSPKSDARIASTQEKRNTLMRRINKWRELQLVYMPGVVGPSLYTPDDITEDNNSETAESIPLFLPSSLDPERRERICLQQVAEHERLLRMAQLQDSLIELRHTRKIRRRLLVNHYTQVTGQRAGTRSCTVLNSVETRITKFVERYRVAYRALLQLDPTGNWRETYLELKESDNRGPGKESDEVGTGDGSYFRSWIWLQNPRVPDATGDVGEEGASEEDVNEVLRVEWTTSYARLERWKEEVDLLQEEMRRVVVFLEWKSQDWLAKVDIPWRTSTPDVQSGLDAYAKKQAAVYHNLAVSFVNLWRPTLVSYGLKHSWMTEHMTKAGVPLTDTIPASNARGIFKFRLSDEPHGTISATEALPVTTTDPPILEEDDYDTSEDSGLDDSDLDSEDDWDDYLDF